MSLSLEPNIINNHIALGRGYIVKLLIFPNITLVNGN